MASVWYLAVVRSVAHVLAQRPEMTDEQLERILVAYDSARPDNPTERRAEPNAPRRAAQLADAVRAGIEAADSYIERESDDAYFMGAREAAKTIKAALTDTLA